MSYVFIESEPGLWTVGHYAPDGAWEPESDHERREAAAERVAWLNGGEKLVSGERHVSDVVQELRVENRPGRRLLWLVWRLALSARARAQGLAIKIIDSSS